MSEAEDLRESMLTFEAALSGQKVVIPSPAPEAILLAIDGSNQDPTAEALAVLLARRLDTHLHVTYAYEGPRDDQRERYLAEHTKNLMTDGLEVASSRVGESIPSFEQILAIARVEACGLIVTCAPYLEDIGELGQESIGSNLDMLMSRSRMPLLIVREPKDDPGQCLRDILIPVAHPPSVNLDAAGWALRLVEQGGTIRLLIVADTAAIDKTSQLLGDYVDVKNLDPELLANLETKENAGLIGALQKKAAEAGFGCKVTARTGDPVAAVVEVANAEDRLIILGYPRERTSANYQRAQALIRESRNPVLLV